MTLGRPCCPSPVLIWILIHAGRLIMYWAPNVRCRLEVWGMHYTLAHFCTSPHIILFAFPLINIIIIHKRAYNIHPNAGGFVIGAGAVLGICAGMLWTAQGSLMLAYPTESQKGMFIGIFWAIFNLGGVVGASVSLGQNFHSTVRVIIPTFPSLSIHLC